MKKVMLLVSCLDYLVSRFITEAQKQDYSELKDWVEASVKHARAVMRGEEPLDMEAYENLYCALFDLADWYRMDVIYD